MGGASEEVKDTQVPHVHVEHRSSHLICASGQRGGGSLKLHAAHACVLLQKCNSGKAMHVQMQVDILCNNCLAHSRVPFHVVGHKCTRCQGFNTRRI